LLHPDLGQHRDILRRCDQDLSGREGLSLIPPTQSFTRVEGHNRNAV
jgi:hypothetical protein